AARRDLAMPDAMMQYLRVALAPNSVFNNPVERNGPKVISGGPVPSGISKRKPGGPNHYVYAYTSRANPAHWHNLLKVIGHPELIGDERYDTPAARSEREEEIDAMIAAWACNHDKREAMRILRSAGGPAAAVYDTMEPQNQ